MLDVKSVRAFHAGSTCAPQAEIYIPTIASSTFGIVRAYQKDGTDVETGNAAVIYIDSDGIVAQNALDAPVTGSGALSRRVPFGILHRAIC